MNLKRVVRSKNVVKSKAVCEIEKRLGNRKAYEIERPLNWKRMWNLKGREIKKHCEIEYGWKQNAHEIPKAGEIEKASEMKKALWNRKRLGIEKSYEITKRHMNRKELWNRKAWWNLKGLWNWKYNPHEILHEAKARWNQARGCVNKLREESPLKYKTQRARACEIAKAFDTWNNMSSSLRLWNRKDLWKRKSNELELEVVK